MSILPPFIGLFQIFLTDALTILKCIVHSTDFHVKTPLTVGTAMGIQRRDCYTVCFSLKPDIVKEPKVFMIIC